MRARAAVGTRLRAGLIVLLVLTLTACTAPPTDSSGPEATDRNDAAVQAPQLPPPGAGEDFYSLPEKLPEGEPGRLLRLEELSTPAGINGWRVLYHSRAVDGRDIAVSGLIFAPAGPADTPRTVVAWGHGSVGLGDSCAPSRTPEDFPNSRLFTELLDQGFVLAATDYEGLGTPGPHPWLVGESEGRSMLDSVRAAARIGEAGAGNRFVAFGASQGGGAALFAGELAPEYAGELELLGVVAAAPAAELDLIELVELLPMGQNLVGIGGFVVMGALGFSAAYPELGLDDILEPEVIEQREEIGRLCQNQIEQRFRGIPLERLLSASPGTVPNWAEAIRQNTAGRRETPAPVLVVHGTLDRVVPAQVSELLYQRLCGLGVEAERQLYPGVNHGDVVSASAGDVVPWIEDRAAGRERSPHPDRQLC
ncbi:MAG TPA: lipase family protein [Actinomycetota bacterium]|nr:lipase family protein [Actinomycetota bacterium]